MTQMTIQQQDLHYKDFAEPEPASVQILNDQEGMLWRHQSVPLTSGLTGATRSMRSAKWLQRRLAKYVAEDLLGWSETATMLLVGLAIWLAVLAVDGLLIWTGGWLFRRFDVARDRG